MLEENDTPKEPELPAEQKKPTISTKKRKDYASEIDPSRALSPYEDPREVEKHFPSNG